MNEKIELIEAHSGYTHPLNPEYYNPAGTVNSFKKNNRVPAHTDVFTIKTKADSTKQIDDSKIPPVLDATYEKIVQSGYEAKREFQTKVVSFETVPNVDKQQMKSVVNKNLIDSLNKFNKKHTSGYQVENNTGSNPLTLMGYKEPKDIKQLGHIHYQDANGFNGYDRINYKTTSYLT